jgi:hypothetical protein
VASPDTSDAEAPRLLARAGGWWLAWLAHRTEVGEDAGATAAVEAPGERRANQWVELVALDAKGEAASPVRRVTSDKDHVASFDLTAGAGTQVVVVVQDETAHAEGAGERVVRYLVDGEKIEGADLLDGGVGHALAELLPEPSIASAPRWLAFSDVQERAHLVPLAAPLKLAGAPTVEPALDGARLLASTPPDVVFAVGAANPGAGAAADGRLELRRLVCR